MNYDKSATGASVEIGNNDYIDKSNTGNGFFFNFDNVENEQQCACHEESSSKLQKKEETSYIYLESIPWERISVPNCELLKKWLARYPDNNNTGIGTWCSERSVRVSHLEQNEEQTSNKQTKRRAHVSAVKNHNKAAETLETKPLQLILKKASKTPSKSEQEEQQSYIICYQSPPFTSTLTSNSSYKDEEEKDDNNYDNDNDDDIRGTKSKTRKAHYRERDIIPGKYYGGLKVWSCAPMLTRYLVAHEEE